MDSVSAIILFPETPKIFLSAFHEYIQYWNEVPCIMSSTNPEHGSFLKISAQAKETSVPWEIEIPSGYVLAIVDMREGKHPVGFLPS